MGQIKRDEQGRIISRPVCEVWGCNRTGYEVRLARYSEASDLRPQLCPEHRYEALALLRQSRESFENWARVHVF